MAQAPADVPGDECADPRGRPVHGRTSRYPRAVPFEDEIAALAAQKREREQQRERRERQQRAATRETVTGFIRLLLAHGYAPVPIFAEGGYRRAIVLWDVQHFEQAGVGWHLTVPGDGGNSSLVVAESGAIATLGFLIGPGAGRHEPISSSGTRYKGLPRSGGYIRVHGRVAEGVLSSDEERAVKDAAVRVVRGATQQTPGSA